MITAIAEHEITWQCNHHERGEPLCEMVYTVTLDELVYRFDGYRNKRRDLSAVILLPRCPVCESVTSLKADYTIKELWELTQTFVNARGEVLAYSLPLRYANSLIAHWMLYEAGRAEYVPLVSMPDAAMLEKPQFKDVPLDVAHAMWFGFQAVKGYQALLAERKQQKRLRIKTRYQVESPQTPLEGRD